MLTLTTIALISLKKAPLAGGKLGGFDVMGGICAAEGEQGDGGS